MGRDGRWQPCHLFFFASLFFVFPSQPWTDRWCRGWSVWNARAAADVTSGRCGYHKRRQWWIRRQGNAAWCENQWCSDGLKEREKSILAGCRGNGNHQMCSFENKLFKIHPEIDLRPNSNCTIFIYVLFIFLAFIFPQLQNLHWSCS